MSALDAGQKWTSKENKLMSDSDTDAMCSKKRLHEVAGALTSATCAPDGYRHVFPCANASNSLLKG